MDYKNNKCPVCMKHFCCSSHRADHEVKIHSEMYPELKQDFLVRLFQKRAEAIILKSKKRQATVVKEKEDNYINENILNKSSSSNLKPKMKRVHSEINKCVLSTSVTVSETRRILVPTHRLTKNVLTNNKALVKSNSQSQNFEGSQKEIPHDNGQVKTSTPILENILKEETPMSNWDIISPASTISCYGTPYITKDANSEGLRQFKSQSTRLLVTPLRSIMAKNSKYMSGSDLGMSPNLNSSRGRKVTFSFSSSRVSSVNSSPLESVEEVHNDNQDENREVIESISSFQNYNKREITTNISQKKNYLVEVTSTVNSCVETSELCEENIRNVQIFSDDSLASFKGGLFSCVTSMFCSAVQTIPLWRPSNNRNGNRSKRSRSPDREPENIVVLSPLHKRPRYPYDLRLNPIKARKPISNS